MSTAAPQSTAPPARQTSERSAELDALGDPVGPKRWPILAGFVALCVLGGALIGVAFAGQTDAYETFNLPTWAPPSWLFGPVWTVLYTVMAIGAWMVARVDLPLRTRATVAFAVQLAVNFAWTPVFFGMSAPAAGFVVIVAVLLAAGWWAFEASRVRRVAGWLQIPYLAWVSFATVLNGAIAFG
ncbi:TspO/MBR family protein [Euzebya tangerina]|uniref:TspO/MBR family protein n=1 Tax=Euzebya tangerina TaxID=591198 RepID=UPI002F340364